MIFVIGTFRFPLENLQAAQSAMVAVVEASCKEPGCITYSYASDVADQGLFRVVEAWRDRDTLDQHFQTEHMRIWSEERAKLGFFERDISVHEVSSSAPL